LSIGAAFSRNRLAALSDRPHAEVNRRCAQSISARHNKLHGQTGAARDGQKTTAANFDGSGSMLAMAVLPHGIAQQSVSRPIQSMACAVPRTRKTGNGSAFVRSNRFH
jgi:hypothetical protein